MTTTVQFDHQERAAFDAYCLALIDLVDEGDDAGRVIARSGAKCCYCSTPVPAGIPSLFRGTDRDACPKCVLGRGMHTAVHAELNRGAPEYTAAERRSLLESCMPPSTMPAKAPRELGAIIPRRVRGTVVARGLDATIDRLENDLTNPKLDVMARDRTERLLEAARTAKARGSAA